MRYEIDQSIKIEDTARATYVAITNSKNIVVSISSKEKKKVEKYYRVLEKPLIFKIFTFSILCAEAISSMDLRKEKCLRIGANQIIKIDRVFRG